MKYFLTIGLLLLSNAFKNLAWYGHLKFFGKNSHAANHLIGFLLLIGSVYFTFKS